MSGLGRRATKLVGLREPGVGEDLDSDLVVAGIPRLKLGTLVVGPLEPFRDLLAEQVELTLVRCEAVGIGAEHDTTHPVGGEEAVLDALGERVLEDRITEVVVAVDGLVALGRGGHTELRGGAEVVENRAPRRFGAGAPAMALVDDDQVEEVWLELPEDAVGVVPAVGERLVKREVDLAAGLRLTPQLPDRPLSERLAV